MSVRDVTLREAAVIHGYRLATVRAWSIHDDDWPPVLGQRRTLESRGAPAYTYAAAQVAAWVARNGSRSQPDDQWQLDRAAAETGFMVSTLRSHRRRGTFPHPDGYRRRSPWWTPATVREWATARQIPPGAWTAANATEFTGRPAALRWVTAPPPDGITAAGVRWWHPRTVQSWWGRTQAVQAELAAGTARDGPHTDRADQETQWSGRDVARATGLSYDSVRTYRKTGKLPPADGSTPAGRPWWQPETILVWDRPATTGRPRRARTSR